MRFPAADARAAPVACVRHRCRCRRPHAAAASLLEAREGLAHEALSDREFEVMRLLVEGLGPTEIGERLHLSVKTVSTHKANILQKMNMTTQAELIRYAINERLVDDGSN